MATNTLAYMSGRRKYQRPQGVLWADNPGVKIDGKHIPDGYEINANPNGETDLSILNQFIILSDDNRDSLDFSIERLETRERMINGRMRSYHIADKLSLSLSWNSLPSRSFALNPNFDLTNGKSPMDGSFGKPSTADQQYTTDGGAGGAELLEWYENHKGSFWVYLSYDKYENFTTNKYAHLPEYSQVIEMFISDFSYTVTKRGGTNYDLWDVTVSLEEV